MRVNIFLFFIVLGTIFALVSSAIIIFYIDPQQSIALVFAIFYLSLLLTFIGAIFLISNWLRSKFSRRKIIYNQINNSLRQSIFFAFLIVGSIILKSHHLLTWWNVSLFILTLTVLELFFLVYNRQKKPVAKERLGLGE